MNIAKICYTSGMKIKIIIFVLLLALAGGGCVLADFLTTPEAPVYAADFSNLTKSISHPKLDCADLKQGAVASTKYGVLAKCGDDVSMPIASMTKIITALTVVEQKRAQLDEIVKLDAQDVEIWRKVFDESGTNIRVYEGEELTLRKMLTGMIVASANNLANSIAVHFYGSIDAYLDAARDFLKQHNIEHTQLGGDASGFDFANRSNATDMAQLGVLAVKDADLKEIVNTREVEFPDASVEGADTEIERSTTFLHLGPAYDGVKSGYTEEAGLCLTFAKAAQDDPDNIIVGTVMGGADDYDYHNVAEFIDNADARFKPVSVAQAGSSVGVVTYQSKLQQWEFSVQIPQDVQEVLPVDCQLGHTEDFDSVSSPPQLSITTTCNDTKIDLVAKINIDEVPKGVFR
jgi:D-alanyl-D-alanine carboxypeptidase (penicillin-binding protein 5/6)